MNKKILISIIVVLILLAGMIIYIILLKPPVPRPHINTFEECVKAGYPALGSYPRQCKTPDGRKFTEREDSPTPIPKPSPSPAPQPAPLAISPFGIMAAFAPSTLTTIRAADKIAWAGEKFRDLGAKWSRSVGETIIWGIIEPELGKGYDWSNSDEVLKKAYENGGENFNMVVVISPPRFKGDNPDIPLDEENYYSKFVEELVERYDGDGINDYDSIIKVKYWQMENEPFPWQWENRGGTIDGYVKFAELTHNAIKKSDPNAKIILGTFQFETTEEVNEFKEVISKMRNKNLFDYADTHYWGARTNYKIPIGEAKSILDSNGYSNAKMVALEFGTTVRKATEKDQANYLIKGYAYNIAHGFSLINWNNLVEWKDFGRPGGMFNYMGLIADGENGDPIPAGTPRLSYFTYKKMTETLEESDWDNIQTIQESDGVYVYKFNKNGKSIWVAWYDNAVSQPITLDVNNKRAKITETVPKYDLGKDVTDYNSAFNSYVQVPKDGKISITLEDSPVFVEEQ